MRKPHAQLQSIAQEHLGLNLSELDFSALAAPVPSQVVPASVSLSPQQIRTALEAAFAAGQVAATASVSPPSMVGAHDHTPPYNALRRQPQVIVLDPASAESVGAAVTRASSPA